MKSAPRRRDIASVIGVPLTVAVVLGAQLLEGGAIRTLLQPTAALVVFGGTFAALLVSYPVGAVGGAVRAALRAFDAPAEPDEQLVKRLTEYASRARRQGVGALEAEIDVLHDPFLKRALELVVDGFRGPEVRRLLETDSETRELHDEEPADVLEAAAGYAPTLGILGAVLGLIHVMENLASPGRLGAGIAVAFVATVYGVGSANLLLLPLATKVRARARAEAVSREVVIEAISAIQLNTHPRLVEQHLSAFLRARRELQRGRVAA
ncbi:MAG: flagellar motor protein [Acidobacteria bacterium]|nr:flagellar motor protein [Acidobacteriota bacterium]